jgi:hypothetical protein
MVARNQGKGKDVIIKEEHRGLFENILYTSSISKLGFWLLNSIVIKFHRTQLVAWLKR